MGNNFGVKGGGIKSGAAGKGDEAGGGRSVEVTQAIGVLTAKGPLTSSALVGLHQGLVDPKLVHKVLSARKAGAHLAAPLDAKGKSIKQLVGDGGFDWGTGDKQKAGEAKGDARGDQAVDLSVFPVESPLPAVDGAEKGDSQGAPGGATQGDVAGQSSEMGGVQVARHSTSGEALQSAHVESVLDGAASKSSAGSLPAPVQSQMESSFGRSFDGVRVHTDAPAQQAAQQLSANAFTVGSDVYFGGGQYQPESTSGQRLIAHELTHVAQNAGLAASSQGGGPSVSHPADAAEQAADRAAQAVVEGRAVGEIGAAPANVLHRDAFSELDTMAGGNWVGTVDQENVITRIRGLSAADRIALITSPARNNVMRRVAQGLDAAHMIQIYTFIPVEFRWRVYWLNEGGQLARLSQNHWQWLLGFATPEDMRALRQYPAGYRMFLQNAPRDMVPPWDLLEGMGSGAITLSPVEVRNATNRLNPDQKTQLALPAHTTTMLAIATHAGDASETFRTLTYLALELKWSVYWLNRAGKIAQLNRVQWGQLLAEAPRQQFDNLVGWPEMWAVVQANCDPGVISIVRSQTAPAAPTAPGVAPAPSTTSTSLDDQVQVDAMFTSLGPEGFLAIVTRTEAEANYAKVKLRGKVTPTLSGLHRGAQLGVAAKANLKKWFDAEHDAPTLTTMFEVRFNVNASPTAANKARENAKHWDKVTSTWVLDTDIGVWSEDALRHNWTVCERLPPAQVEGNPRLREILQDNAARAGNAYFGGNAAVMGTSGSLEEGMDRQHVFWEFEKNPDGSWKIDPGTGYKQKKKDAAGQWVRAHGVAPSKYNAALRHEIGHAVDAALNIMQGGWRTRDVAGGWVQYDSYDAFVSAIITDFGGLDAPANCPAGQQSLWRRAMLHCMNNTVSFASAVAAVDSSYAGPIPDAGPASALFVTTRWTGGGDGPWYNPAGQKTGRSGRRYQRSYENAGRLFSYLGAIRDAREVTQYQWRAPGEWFAEVYQVYYAEQERGPDVPVGGMLRSKDVEAANMLSALVDRGYSPQQMQGGGTASAPGVGGNQGTPAP